MDSDLHRIMYYLEFLYDLHDMELPNSFSVPIEMLIDSHIQSYSRYLPMEQVDFTNSHFRFKDKHVKLTLSNRIINATAWSTDTKGKQDEQVDSETDQGNWSSGDGHESANRQRSGTPVTINELRSREWWNNKRKSCSAFWTRVWRKIVAYATNLKATIN